MKDITEFFCFLTIISCIFFINALVVITKGFWLCGAITFGNFCYLFISYWIMKYCWALFKIAHEEGKEDEDKH